MITLNSYIQEYDKGLDQQEKRESQQEQELRQVKEMTTEQLESIKNLYSLDLSVSEMLEVSDCPVKTSLTSAGDLIKDWNYYYDTITDMTEQDWKDLQAEYNE